ncbi:DUF5686 and carboxypeptidase regulatory-like domain-containing protein [Paucihalobacter sp.]|uniref:DUF5686 and carboxypeptidase regulatory-like domain-containing protein n=1 Tax=Paucihalobacter sp. TaxID=2850405 RepID=UPI002FE2E739
MKSILTFIALLVLPISVFSQVKGSVTNINNEALAYVNVFIENTYTGTTTNEAGKYELNISKPGNYTLVFQYLGYKTQKVSIEVNEFPIEKNVTLEETQISLNEIVINADENPANLIIRNAIDNRKKNLEKINSFSASFYSRGLIRIKDAPEKILGVEVGDLGGGLDSTRSGIIYLSETVSKLKFLRPDKLKETIMASKVSGDESGFSFNNASDVDYNFYNNTIELGNQIVSPIADFAFSHYNYKLEGTFYDEQQNLINKIIVTPKRAKDRVFSGYIYIVEDQWTIYATELSITGEQARIPAADILTISQNFTYSATDKIWALISQNIDFKYGLFGIKGDGRFTAVYSDYNFNNNLSKKDFNRELVSFIENANKKDSAYWTMSRPVPLTTEEITDYVKKDSIQILKKSKPYLDSVDRAKNRFKPLSALTGYTYQNSHKNTRIGYNIPIGAVQFNTVQGYHAGMNFFYTKGYDEFRRYFSANASLNYGFSDDRLRATGSLTYKFNNISKAILSLSGGVTTEQFNSSEPITPLANSFTSLFFESNFMKLYDKSFLQLTFSEEIANGFRLFGTMSYERRKALFNTSDEVYFDKNDKIYSSNNPLDPAAFGVAPFDTHNIVKLNVAAQFNFGQNYLSYPRTKSNIPNDKFPTLTIGYEQGLGATNSNYNFQQIKARLYQSFDISNKGRFSYNMRSGKLFNAENIAFMDFQHFNGNQTRISTNGSYTDVFNNLEYYRLSTNNSYFESHIEHNFNGYLLNKIPLINKLGFSTVIGIHNLSTSGHRPYHEFSVGLDKIGWGKFRFLRVDYVRSYQGGYIGDAIIFGLNFFN